MRSSPIALLLALPLGVSLPASPASAGPLAPSRASQVAVLHPTVTGSSPCGSSAYPVDGMRTSSGAIVPFEIPPKKVFVVTSVDVFGSADPNRHYRFALALATTPSIPGGYLVVGEAVTDAAGYYAGSVSVPTGAVVPPGALLCAQLTGPTNEPTFMRVHGFFAKNK